MQKSFEVYQKNQIMTASNEKLLLLLCDGLVRFIRNGVSALEEGRIEDINTNLLKAQAIVSELMVSLDREAGEFAQNLYLVYEFLHRGLTEANIKKDAHLIQELLGLAMDLQGTWIAVARSLTSGRELNGNIAH